MLREIFTACCLIGTSLSLAVKKSYSNSSDFAAPLQFTSDGHFQLSIFEDLHFGENAWDTWGPQQDINSVKVLNEVLDAEAPQLVVLNGDLITGENTFLENSTYYVNQIVAPLVQRGLSWASTYGNHDWQYNISGETIFAREKMWPNSRTNKMVTGTNAGVSNYFLPVYDPMCATTACAPELLLWFFDSKGGVKYQQKDASGNTIANPDWVDQTVVDWFIQTNNLIVNTFGKAIPSLAFVHIPTNASLAFQNYGVDPNKEPGVNDDVPLAQQAQGWCSDGTNTCSGGYGGQDIPFMKAITSTPGLMAVFSGHDHGDTWCYKWQDSLLPEVTTQSNGVKLCFGQHSGYGGYGNWIRGSRQVYVTKELLQELAVDTWIRLEDGNKVGSVTLNSTYGQDVYPATPDSMTYCPTCSY